jgi:nitrogenase molybdenum-iron protein alpha/beta subunit
MTLLKSRTPRAREKRIDTLNAWLGSAESTLDQFTAKEPEQRIRTFAQSAQDDLICALRLLGGVRNSVTIVHAPRGCAAASLWRHLQTGGGRWVVTNLDQRDTIMGADRKLRQAVTSSYRRYQPEVLFIVAGPVAAINNDDIQAVVDELREELGVPIVPVFTSGFASRSAVSGYDIALHAIMKHLVGSGGATLRNEAVNLLSVAEGVADRLEAVRLLASLGIELNVLPDAAGVENFRRAAGARLSVSLDQDSANYLGIVLEEEYDVPTIDQPRPVGLRATGRWLLAAGEALGVESVARALHERESERVRQALVDFSLEGRRVYLSLVPSTAFAVAELVEEFGGELAGLTVSHLGRLQTSQLELLSSRHPALQIHVADGQPFEELNIVRRIAPDLYIGDGAHLGQLSRLGIPVVSLENTPFLGYEGVLSVARRISAALRNRAFVEALAVTGTPYREEWLKRSPNWHIKKEVK